MPPFLRDGQPVNQRPRSQPTRVYTCQCIECSQETRFNPLLRRFVAGRDWPRRLYVEHRRSIDTKANDPPHDDSDVAEHDLDPSLSDHSDHSGHSQHSSNVTPDHEHTEDSNSIQVGSSRPSSHPSSAVDLLASIISDLKDFFMSDTQEQAGRSAISPLFCDLPGARQILFLEMEASSPAGCSVCQQR